MSAATASIINRQITHPCDVFCDEETDRGSVDVCDTNGNVYSMYTQVLLCSLGTEEQNKLISKDKHWVTFSIFFFKLKHNTLYETELVDLHVLYIT